MFTPTVSKRFKSNHYYHFCPAYTVAKAKSIKSKFDLFGQLQASGDLVPLQSDACIYVYNVYMIALARLKTFQYHLG